MCGFAMYDLPNVHDHRLRRRLEPAEGRGLPRAGRADLVVRGRELHRRAGARTCAWIRWRCARRTRRTKAPRRCTGRPGPISAISTPWRRSGTTRTTRSRSAPTRAAASPAASGSMSAANSSAAVHVNEDGSVSVASGSPDIGGSRASMAMMAAETLGTADRAGEADRRRHRLDRVYPCDRRQPRDLRHRHGDGAGGREGHRPAEAARRDDLGHQPRGGRLEGRLRACRPAPMPAPSSRCHWPRSRSRRRAPAARSAPRCRSTRKAPARLCDACLRCRGRSRDRSRQRAALHRGAGCRPRDPSQPMSRARSRAASPRASAGRSTRNTSTTSRAAWKTRAFSTTAARSPPTCR